MGSLARLCELKALAMKSSKTAKMAVRVRKGHVPNAWGCRVGHPCCKVVFDNRIAGQHVLVADLAVLPNRDAEGACRERLAVPGRIDDQHEPSSAPPSGPCLMADWQPPTARPSLRLAQARISHFSPSAAGTDQSVVGRQQCRRLFCPCCTLRPHKRAAR